jgi:hypothetical protein
MRVRGFDLASLGERSPSATRLLCASRHLQQKERSVQPAELRLGCSSLGKKPVILLLDHRITLARALLQPRTVQH